MWEHIRKKRLNGYRFVRQKPFIYKEDNNQKFFSSLIFYCADKKLVIELDGKNHQYKKYYDYQRDLVLKELGLTTLRIKNEELRYIEKTKRKIRSYLE